MLFFFSTFKRALSAVCWFLLSFLFLYLIFDTIEHVRIILAYKADTSLLLKLAVIHLPTAVYQLLPVALFTGSAYVMLEMIHERELVVLLTSGQGRFKRALPFVAVCILVSLFMILWGDLVLPAAEQQYRYTVDIEIKHKNNWGDKYRPKKMWFSGPSGMWRIKKVEKNTYYGVDLFHEDNTSGKKHYKALSMIFAENGWSFSGLRIFDDNTGEYRSIEKPGFKITEGEHHFEVIWDTAEEMNITSLVSAIRLKKLQGMDTSGYETSLYSRMALPMLAFFLPLLVMQLIWSKKQLTSPSRVVAISHSFLILLTFFLLIRVIQSLSYSQQINPAVIFVVPLVAVVFLVSGFRKFIA